MREILFRGKRVYDNEWVYGNLINWHPKINPRIIYYEDCEIEQFKETNHQVFKNTIGQFTGLTDKNGVKIFEGDITNFGEVLFYFGCFCIKCEDYGNEVNLMDFNIHKIEIIGNIHE